MVGATRTLFEDTAMPHDDLAAILLVGGRSSRMGRPKAWLDLDGASLLARVVERVRAGVDEIVLVAARDGALPPLAPPRDGRPPRVVYDVRPDEGPLPALALGLASVHAGWALALGCDAPLVRADVVARLVAERGDDVDVVVPVWDDRPQPLVALYRTTLAPTLAALAAAGERRLHVVAAGARVRCVSADKLRVLDPDGESFAAANTPEEFVAVAARWRARRA